jgi:hypothetical protein
MVAKYPVDIEKADGLLNSTELALNDLLQQAANASNVTDITTHQYNDRLQELLWQLKVQYPVALIDNACDANRIV